MVHESVFDVIDDDDSDYEDGCEEEDDEVAGQLQSGFKAMDIARAGQEEGRGEMAGGEVGAVRGKEAHRKKKNRKKWKGDRRKQPEQVMSIERFVVQTCRRIEETKYPLFREAVDRIGVDAMKALLNQVDVIEKCGGQMTADGARRRSAGGVLWNLLRDHVGPLLYKEIMKEGNRKHIEQQKARAKERESEKGNGKRQHPDADERQDAKRRRTSDHGHASRGVSRERHSSLREEADNVRAPAALQNAWVQGLKRQSLNPKPLEGGEGVKRPVSERIRLAVSYGDLVEEGQIATESPIRLAVIYGDLVEEGQIVTESPIHGVTEVGVGEETEEGEIAD